MLLGLIIFSCVFVTLMGAALMHRLGSINTNIPPVEPPPGIK